MTPKSHHLKVLAITLLVLPTIYLCAETFITPKKKAPSLSKLKEECCQECAAILELTPEILRSIADIQQMALGNVRCYMDDGKEGFIASKSKEKLAASQEKLVALRGDLEALSVQIKSTCSYLESLSVQNKLQASNIK